MKLPSADPNKNINTSNSFIWINVPLISRNEQYFYVILRFMSWNVKYLKKNKIFFEQNWTPIPLNYEEFDLSKVFDFHGIWMKFNWNTNNWGLRVLNPY